jgi:hypothetical protein
MKEPEVPDLDFGDEPDDPNIERDTPVIKFERTKLNVLGTPLTDVDRARVRAHLIAHRAEKGRGPDGVPLEKFRHETHEAPVVVTDVGVEIPWEDLLGSGKSLARRAAAAGWKVIAGRSRTHVAPTLYQYDSEEDGKDQHQAGDVRYPAEDRIHFVLHAQWEPPGHPLLAAFRLYYQSRPNKKGGHDTAFIYGEYLDPTGDRVTVFPGATVSKMSSEASLVASESITAFNAWFDVLVPPAKPRAKKDSRSKEERLLDGEEWEE